MAFPYPSDAWIKELRRVCNDDPEFTDSCTNFSGKMVWQIEAEPGRLDKTAYLYCWIHHGELKEAEALNSTDEKPDVEYIITGKYQAWKEIVKGRLEPLRALTTRKVKLVKGSQLKLLKQVKMAMRMMNNCVKVDAIFVDEKA
jgi:putative sterol carrier protein